VNLLIGSGVGASEDGNEMSSSLKVRQFLYWLTD
jgi:hypothetical protein